MEIKKEMKALTKTATDAKAEVDALTLQTKGLAGENTTSTQQMQQLRELNQKLVLRQKETVEQAAAASQMAKEKAEKDKEKALDEFEQKSFNKIFTFIKKAFETRLSMVDLQFKGLHGRLDLMRCRKERLNGLLERANHERELVQKEADDAKWMLNSLARYYYMDEALMSEFKHQHHQHQHQHHQHHQQHHQQQQADVKSKSKVAPAAAKGRAQPSVFGA